jgi:hypothetical protein
VHSSVLRLLSSLLRYFVQDVLSITLGYIHLARTADRQLHQVVHKRLQADIIREDGLCSLRDAAICACLMCRRRVEFREKETRLGTTSIADNEAGQGEAVLNKILGVFLGRLKQGAEVLVALLVLVARFPPLGHGLAVEDEDVEEGVEEEDRLRLNGSRVEEHRLAAFVVEAVAVKCGLNHDERVAYVFVIEYVAVECGLVRRVVENL